MNCLRFEVDLLDNLCRLRRELTGRTYRPSTSICFVQKKPKMREIFAADFRDRVVHHLLVGYLEPFYEQIFIHDSYACRVGRGVHGGVSSLRSFLHKVTANGTKQAWYLKLDIRGFFMNLDKEILYGLRGFHHGCGFHYSRLGRYLNLAREHGFHVALLREHREEDGRISRRLARFFRSCSGADTELSSTEDTVCTKTQIKK